MAEDEQYFHGDELLLLKKLQSDPHLCREWRLRIEKADKAGDVFDLGDVPHSLLYLALDSKKERFLKFIREKVQQCQDESGRIKRTRESLLTSYLNRYQFTELHLDGIFKYGDDNTLPVEIFKCPSVRSLSMKYNNLNCIPPDIGRMSSLEYLALTNNKLQNKSIPYTLTFCTKLRTLMLDNNLLDALPGFLLRMSSLLTVHRHGNHNYFKSTFMWYHTDVTERILELFGPQDFMPREPESLQFWAAKAVIGSKMNFYKDIGVASVLKDYISDIYNLFNVCGKCNIAKLNSKRGYKVITFKNPYLGNTCVPFQHWACSLECAEQIEIPARREQIAAAQALDKEYDAYIRTCQRQYHSIQRRSQRLHQRQSRSYTAADAESLSSSFGCGSTTSCSCAIV